jgi:hypothetical protein
VDDTSTRMAAAASPDADANDALDVGSLAAVAGLLAASGFRPRAEWQAQFEGALAGALAPGGAARLGAGDLAGALSALAAWGRKAGPPLAGAAAEASRRALAEAPPGALGPLLLGLAGVGAPPGGAWMVDWEGVTRNALAAAAAAPWRAGRGSGSGGDGSAGTSSGGAAAAGIAPGDVASIVAAAARAPRWAPGDAWLARAGTAAAAALPDASDSELAALASGLHGLKFRPPLEWAAAAEAEVNRRRGGRGPGSADVAAAAAWLAALRVAE